MRVIQTGSARFQGRQLPTGETAVASIEAQASITQGSDSPSVIIRLPGVADPAVPSAYVRWIKPLLDRCGAAMLLIVLSPTFLAVALAVRIQLGRPVIFRQTRLGKDGRRFEILKFRSMRPDRRLRDLDGSGYDGPERRKRHKVENDPRLVPVGRFIRRWSLDELPQLINVLRGEMSLVGPRPEMVEIVEKHYTPRHHRRHVVKPGITGLWQISDRNGGLMHEQVDIDLRYVERMSPTKDLRILFATIPALLGFGETYRGF